MPFENQLTELKNKINQELEEFFDLKIREIKKRRKPSLLKEMVENIRDFTLSSGKRIRPILFYYGYLLAGGRDKKNVLKAAVSIELIHTYLLIHDDIIDRDNFRRHRMTMHYYYEKEYKNKFKNKSKNIKHFGISMGIIAGDLASAFGYEILSRSDLPENLKVRAINKFNRIIADTITGEEIDVFLEMFADFDMAKILKMQGYKTAKYTIEGPLHLGAILAGADDKFLESLTNFAIPLGIAYQIKDDIIGVFGDKKRTGKPVGTDIREGKATLLISKTLERADSDQKKIINSALGNEKIKIKEVSKVRSIIKETKSLEYSQDQVKKFSKSARANLKKIKVADERCRIFLEGLVDFMAKREF